MAAGEHAQAGAAALAPLLRPFRLGALTLPNRVAMAPMTRRACPGGVPGPANAEYYRRRAAGGVGLIITEGIAIDHPVAVDHADIPTLAGPAFAGWRDVVRAVQAAGAAIFAQFWHVGGWRLPGSQPHAHLPPLSPSGLRGAEEQVGVPATETEIAEVLAAYRRSAAAARAAGFDGIEIHGAHGYLIDQFLWAATNRRGDGWNGDAVARTRFAAAVLRACREGAGPGFPIAFLFSQWKQQDYAARLADTPQALAALLSPLVEAGADILHCSTRRFREPEFAGSPLNLAGWVRRLLGVPTISVGSVGLDADAIASLRQGQSAGVTGVEALLERMAQDEFDLIAIGRALLGDADWFAKLCQGRSGEWRPFTPDAFKTLA